MTLLRSFFLCGVLFYDLMEVIGLMWVCKCKVVTCPAGWVIVRSDSDLYEVIGLMWDMRICPLTSWVTMRSFFLCGILNYDLYEVIFVMWDIGL